MYSIVLGTKVNSVLQSCHYFYRTSVRTFTQCGAFNLLFFRTGEIGGFLPVRGKSMGKWDGICWVDHGKWARSSWAYRERWNEKVWTMFLTFFRRLTTANFPLASKISFLLLGIDRFWMDSFVADSIRAPSGMRTAYCKHWNSSLRKKEGCLWW